MPTLRIRQERINNGWSQEYVGNSLGISLSAAQKIETGQRKPSYEILVKLEDLFNLSHRKLFETVNETFKA